ncbi:hypothetical protein GALL_291360 [mine drainage metagenome]|uniref:Uncharacterized protein n=1 Tax=mine drainage metagenome TaxID=410659 RepID=A0A1J5RLC9_9ZZZZ
MNINRNNYEEFFLLYADGELSAQEQQAVEQFVKDNPDVANELEMLLQTKLGDEEINFTDKNLLYKTNDTAINLNNYEEQFLLYVDDELNDAEKNKVETFVLQHPQMQENFVLLKQTKLEHETVVFPNKKSLYRKEEKPAIYFSFSRMAVAAAFVGLLFLVWTIIPSNNKTSDQIVSAKNNVATVPEKKILNDKIAAPQTNPLVAAKNKIEKKTEKKQVGNFKAAIIPTPDETKNLIAENKIEEKKSSPIKTIRENIVEEKKSIVTPVSNTDNQLAVNKSKSTVPVSEIKNTIHPAVYKELNTDEDERNNNIYIGNVEINKDKLRGFFKRAKAAFSKSKNDDNDNVAIANFSVNTKALK